MRRLVLAAIICAIGMAPAAGRAAEKRVPVQSTPAVVVVGFDETQILAIGAGVVIGAAAGSLVSVRGATLVVAHLRYAPLQTPDKDANTRQDIKASEDEPKVARPIRL